MRCGARSPTAAGAETEETTPTPGAAGGAELGCLVGASAVGGNRHPKTASPGRITQPPAKTEARKLGAPGPLGKVFIAAWWLSPKQNSDSANLRESSLLVPSSPLPSTPPAAGTLPGAQVPCSTRGAPGTFVPKAKVSLGHSTAPEPARPSFRSGCPAGWRVQRWFLLLSLGAVRRAEPFVFEGRKVSAPHLSHST